MTEQCKAETLTTSCGGVCGDKVGCVTYPPPAVCDATLDKGGTCVTKSSSKCTYECFNTTSGDGGFYLVISTDDTKHPQYPTKTNGGVARFDRLTLPPTTSIAFIVSGTQYFEWYYTGGNYFMPVDMSAGFLKDQTQVTNVTLANFVFSKRMAPLTTILPPTISVLDLSHNNLTAVPDTLSNLTDLSLFYASHNRIQVVNIATPMPSLKLVNFANNSISSFEGNFPNVENLYLDSNNLSQIPESVFRCKNLTKLHLSKNPLVSPRVTQEQFNQLQEMFELTLEGIPQAGFKCDNGTVKKLRGFQFCVAVESATVPDPRTPIATSSAPSKPSKTATIAVASAAGVLVLVLVLVILLLVWWRQRTKRSPSKRYTENGRPTADAFNSNGSADARAIPAAGALWQDADLMACKISEDSLTDIRELGAGAFGTVWLVHHTSGRALASKRLYKVETRDHSDFERFIAEIKLDSTLGHKNVIAFFGLAWTSAMDVQALFEFAPNGDLTTWLQQPSAPRQWTTEKFRIAVDVVEALVYVHSFLPPLVHRDLKSRNVLLMNDLTAKLCDFGTARFQSVNATMTIGIGTTRWLAPEMIVGDTDYTSKADIYAFGVVLSELDRHQLPYTDVLGNNGNKLTDVALVHRVGTGMLSPTFSPSCPQNILMLARRCLAFNPDDRPTAMEAAFALREIVRDSHTQREAPKGNTRIMVL